jgi:hypothetical protein
VIDLANAFGWHYVSLYQRKALRGSPNVALLQADIVLYGTAYLSSKRFANCNPTCTRSTR